MDFFRNLTRNNCKKKGRKIEKCWMFWESENKNGGLFRQLTLQQAGPLGLLTIIEILGGVRRKVICLQSRADKSVIVQERRAKDHKHHVYGADSQLNPPLS